MTKRLVAVLSLLLAASIAVAGCSGDRSPLAPAAPAGTTAFSPAAAPSNSLLGGLLGGVIGTLGKLVNVVVAVLERPLALDQDVVWSFDAGPGGAISGNRTVGLSIVVPPGALDRTVRITVRAKKGRVINYQFQPEGLQFAKPVILTQEVPTSLLGGLLGGNRTLKGAYYAAPELQYDPKTGKATVNEFQPTLTAPGYVSFQIRHFSGYVVASCENESSFGWFQ